MPVPSLLSLTDIPDGSQLVASPVRNNYTAIQAAVNALIGFLQGGAAGDVLRFDGTDWAPAAPGSSQLDRKTITADVAGIVATTEGTAAAVITGNSVSYDGTEVKLEFFAPKIENATNCIVTFVLLRDATVVGQAKVTIDSGSAGSRPGEAAVKLEAFDTPAAGAHTYSVKAFVTGGSLTVKAGPGGSGAFLPAFLRVTKA